MCVLLFAKPSRDSGANGYPVGRLSNFMNLKPSAADVGTWTATSRSEKAAVQKCRQNLPFSNAAISSVVVKRDCIFSQCSSSGRLPITLTIKLGKPRNIFLNGSQNRSHILNDAEDYLSLIRL